MSIMPWRECLRRRRSSGLADLIVIPSVWGTRVTPHRAQKLYYHTADFLLPDRQPTSPPTVTTRLEIGPALFEKKGEAFRQHTTQTPLFERVKKNLGQGGGAVEMYHLAATSKGREARLEKDLFEDVTDD